jgi:hypothetical protein
MHSNLNDSIVQRLNSVVVPSGDPVRRGFSVLSLASLQYWIARRSLSSGRPKGRTGWRATTVEDVARWSRNRHCEPTGRANARSMTGSAKQSILSSRGEMDCFASLAMTTKNTPPRSRRMFRASCGLLVPPSRIRGRRECRAPDAPASRVCRDSGCCAHALVRSHRKSPGIPRAVVLTVSFALSSATGLSCHRHRRNCFRPLDASVGASGPHDFSVRELSALVFGTARVHRILSRVRDDLEPPLCGTGQGGLYR